MKNKNEAIERYSQAYSKHLEVINSAQGRPKNDIQEAFKLVQSAEEDLITASGSRVDAVAVGLANCTSQAQRDAVLAVIREKNLSGLSHTEIADLMAEFGSTSR